MSWVRPSLAGRALGICRGTLDRRIALGRVVGVRIGSTIRVNLVEDWASEYDVSFDEHWDVEQLSTHFDAHPATIRTWMSLYDLPFRRRGHAFAATPALVADWVERHLIAPTAPQLDRLVERLRRERDAAAEQAAQWEARRLERCAALAEAESRAAAR